CSKQIYNFKVKHLSWRAGEIEIKGKEIFINYLFGLESKGIQSKELNLARDILNYMKTLGVQLFASIVFSKEELDLSCTNVNQ
ncbi:MAG: hypothetical protein AABZ11_03760, partial [Nitrospinota bacterium]